MQSAFHLSRLAKVAIAGVIGGIIAALLGSVPVCADETRQALGQVFCPLSLHREWMFVVGTSSWFLSYIVDTAIIAALVYGVLTLIEWMFHKHHK